ncbi:GNAT family N-acetyltransferase [Streptacidiphilus sp. N1-12]|uniref:GNAT family N-acetyltransferase n=2 Tax=Streptacidiphilus alkalitolerans TaxID=3342712 RepID=A0ABV6V581_9ACTN
MYVEPPSLAWRPLTTGDAKASADLLNAIEAVDRTGENYDEEDTLQELTDPYGDLERASLGAFDGELMVGYMKTTYRPFAEDVHRMLVDGGVHPDYRRRGVGTALMEAGVAAAKALHALHHPALKLVVDVEKADHVAGVAELFRAQGFAPARYYQHMGHPLGEAIPDPAIPDGLRVEPWSEANDEEFLMIRNESFKDHWGSEPIPLDAWKNRITNQSFQPGVSFLLRDAVNGAPAGMLVTMSWEADTAATGVRSAHFMIIGTLRDYRKRGIAGGLLGHALRSAAEQGFGKANLLVDSANPSGAFRLYEKAGFAPEVRYVRWALEV